MPDPQRGQDSLGAQVSQLSGREEKEGPDDLGWSRSGRRSAHRVVFGGRRDIGFALYRRAAGARGDAGRRLSGAGDRRQLALCADRRCEPVRLPLRRSGKPIVLLANKAEGRAVLPAIGEAYRLGLGDPVPVSAEHGEGLGELYECLEPFSRSAETQASGSGKPLQLAIVGRPNVGKSTLVNRMVGEERMLTGPEAGITRDSISVDWTWQGRPIRLIDTAGLRRKPRVEGKLEQLSVGDALRSICFAESVILVTDALQSMERQDVTLAR